jgi:hypothetical protein
VVFGVVTEDFEALIGLLLEINIVATFTQRYFAR